MDIPTTWEDCPVYTTVPWAEGKRCQESDPIYVFVMCTWLWICRTTFPLNSQSSFLSIPLVFHSVLRLRSRSIIFMKSLTRHQGHRSWDLSISDKYIHQRIYCITGDQGYIRHWWHEHEDGLYSRSSSSCQRHVRSGRFRRWIARWWRRWRNSEVQMLLHNLFDSIDVSLQFDGL